MSTRYFSDLQINHSRTGRRPTEPIRLKDRDYYCLQYNHAGTIQVRIDDGPAKTIQGPSLLITGPGHRFTFGSKEGWHHNYIAFTGPRVERYLETGFLPVDAPLQKIEDSQAFFALFEECVNASKRKNHAQAAYALEGLLLHIHKPPALKEEPMHHQHVRSLADKMRDDPLEVYDLEAEASKMHISISHLRRLFKTLMGIPPGQHLQQCRLSAAADLLATTREPVKVIADECQLGGVHYFTRIFRNHYGQPPARFRREMLGE